ncbi:hypothetical protein NEOLI_001328 [Neolecta irregularis DAH-3]|uniref:Uncharacterized protein n=1 Tax=Neolecta irregularis (strain DAH-3) TaxID=1198029 RepID=A0A1U7LVQ8_NEOID|nr:hypothetical protein NEOLI_001328 [Neolecta irregularis DAH-3]|eukprot:OLL26724.1 hypothetical protein NEOLI_001328 [Neolecta irregularis DAH-3]
MGGYRANTRPQNDPDIQSDIISTDRGSLAIGKVVAAFKKADTLQLKMKFWYKDNGGKYNSRLVDGSNYMDDSNILYCPIGPTYMQ